MFWNKTPSPCSRGVRGSHCVKQRVLTRLSYQPPCRVLLRKKRGWGGGGKDTPESFLPPSCSYTLTMPLSEKSEKILRKGGTGEGGRLWWIIVTSKPDRKYLYLLSAMENGKGTEVMWVHRIGLYLAFFFLPLPLPLPPPLWKVDNPFPWISLHPYGKCHYSARRLI